MSVVEQLDNRRPRRYFLIYAMETAVEPFGKVPHVVDVGMHLCDVLESEDQVRDVLLEALKHEHMDIRVRVEVMTPNQADFVRGDRRVGQGPIGGRRS